MTVMAAAWSSIHCCRYSQLEVKSSGSECILSVSLALACNVVSGHLGLVAVWGGFVYQMRRRSHRR